MKKALLILSIGIFFLVLNAQKLQHEATVTNVEVPVRVYDGDRFIDDLKIEDFELYEEGQLQTIDAVYLINEAKIKEEYRKNPDVSVQSMKPNLSRYYILYFVLSEYMPKVSEAIDYFVDEVLQPDDSLLVGTVIKTYRLGSDRIKNIPKDVIKKQLKTLVRKDTVMGNTEYNNLIRDLKLLVFEYQSRPNDPQIIRKYEMLLSRLRILRYIDTKNIKEFGDFLNRQIGQKHMLLFYQKESIPILQVSFRRVQGNVGNMSMAEADVFASLFNSGDAFFDVDAINEKYADSSVSVHFLYISKSHESMIDVHNMSSTAQDIEFTEKSADVYDAFNKMARATGGISDSTSNISAAAQTALNASEHYYMLYYTPKNKTADGKFRELKVRIKGKKYRVFHRFGYFADTF